GRLGEVERTGGGLGVFRHGGTAFGGNNRAARRPRVLSPIQSSHLDSSRANWPAQGKWSITFHDVAGKKPKNALAMDRKRITALLMPIKAAAKPRVSPAAKPAVEAKPTA